jgi:hypothetical protein
VPEKKIGWGMPLPQGWRAMFAYRGDDGKVVLRTSPLKSWTLVGGPRGRLKTSGVTADGAATGIGNPHFCGYLREGEPAEEYEKVAEAHLRRLEESGAPLWSSLDDYE